MILVVTSDLHFVFVSSFLIFILSLFFICRFSSFTFSFRHHLSHFRGLFTPVLYCQPSPSQSDLQHFHFQPFRYLFTASATVLSGRFLPTGVFYLTLLHWHLSRLTFIKTSLGAGSSSLKFAGLHTHPQNTNPAHLFV